MRDPFVSAASSAEKITAQTLSPLSKGSTSRRLFLRGSLVSAVVAPVGLLAACSASGSSVTPPQTHTSAGNTAAPLALRSPADSKMAFTEIMNDENQHVEYLKAALKGAARAKPTFQKLQQTDIASFAAVSQTLENVGVGAYLMAAPAITSKDILAAAGSILTIEARHAGFLDALLQKPLSPNGAFDKPMTQAEVVTAATPFIASLNGGPDPAAALKSDVDILNFALLLEYLEAEFYSTNVPKLFP